MSRVKRRQLGATIVGICFLLFGLSQIDAALPQATDEQRLRALAEEFFAAYSKKDLDGFTKLWSEASTALGPRKGVIEKLFSDSERIEVGRLEVRKLNIDGEKAKLRIAVEINVTDAKTGKLKAGYGKLNRAIEFVKESGGWKVWREESAEEELAARLVAANTGDERALLLAEDKHLLTRALPRALMAQGHRLRYQEDYSQALAVCHLAMTLSEQMDDKELIAESLNSLAQVHIPQGNYDMALDYLQKSLAIFESAGDKAGMASLLGRIATVHSTCGNYSLAMECSQKSLALWEAVGRKDGIAYALGSIGDIYNYQANYGLALEYHQKKMRLSEEAGYKIGVSEALGDIGNDHAGMGNYTQALEYFQKNLTLLERSGHNSGVAAVLRDLGSVYYLLGNYSQALECFQRNLSLYESVGFKSGIASALKNIGLVYYMQNNFERAIEYAGRASAIAKQINRLETLWEARAIAGRAHRALSQPTEARRSFDDAIEIIETLRSQVAGGEQEQESFFEERVSPYYAMVELLVSQNNMIEALAYAERAKGRALLDVLRSGRVNVTKAMTAVEQEQERALTRGIVSLNSQISREGLPAPPDRLTGLKARLEKARLNYEAFQTGLYAAHPKLKSQRVQTPPLSLVQTSDLLDSKTALLEYVVTEEKTFLFVVTSKDSGSPVALKQPREPGLKVYEIDTKRRALAEQVERFRRRLANRDRDFYQSAADLYELLIKPARVHLQGKTTLVIVPDDALWNLPFQALRPAESRYLVEDSAISYAPSLTVLREMTNARRKETNDATATRELLAMGNPAMGEQTIARVKSLLTGERLEPLPEAERQVKTLGRLYGATGRVYVGPEAREDLFKSEVGKYKILHLATHGMLNDASPMYSYVVLSQTEGSDNEDGLLEAWEMMKLDLKADLVVLSACDTARGHVGAGEGVIGMTWALFVAGCPTTVVSQWKVESASTTELMLEFHRGLKSGRFTKAEALRQAELKLLRSEHYGHPFFWAGFVVVGVGT